MRSEASVVTTSDQGSGSHKITDLWLYVDGKYQGTYPTGNLMPIPSNNKSVRINVFAGIKNNGISDTRIFYPFFDFLTLDTVVEAGKSITRNMTFRYKPATNFVWKENFESPSGYSVKNVSSDTVFQVVPAPEGFEGRSLKLTLAGRSVRARIENSGDGFVLPSGNSNVYLEINYKCNTPFTIGLTSGDGSQTYPALVVNAQENWNKIYVQLSTAVSSIVSNRYKVYFEFLKDADNSDQKQIYLDNIKLLTL